MQYTQLFRSLREAKGLTLEALARSTRKHRNTVVNVESGRRVRLETLKELMLKMGYSADSPEMKAMALLWLEAVSGLPFSHAETEQAARKALASYRSTARQAAKRLDEAISRASLTADQIGLLVFAVRHPEALSILESVRTIAVELASDSGAAELKVAEDK